MSYTFRVGVKTLNVRKSDIKGRPRNLEEKNTIGEMLRKNGYNHACLLLNEDLFEYGANEEQSYERHKNVGRDTSFDWNELGEAMNGTTDVSPDQLEDAIIEAKEWDKGHYRRLKHNCHDFVKFCLKKIGCKECLVNNETILKICYDRKKIKNTVKIRSALGNKNLDFKGYSIKNETEIILKYEKGYGSDQIFVPIYNDDGTVTFTKKEYDNEYAIDVKWSQAKSGTIIQLWEKNGTKAQKFFLREHGEYVSINSSIDPKYVIEVIDEYYFEAKVQLGEYEEGKKSQLFKLI